MGVKRIDNYKDEDNNNKSSTFRYLCTIEELPADKSRQFLVSNDKGAKKIQIAVFNVDGKYYCISNKCQHQGGPLSKGILDEKKKVVTCPRSEERRVGKECRCLWSPEHSQTHTAVHE